MGSESHIDENVIAVKMENIVKKFGSFTANDGINLTYLVRTVQEKVLS